MDRSVARISASLLCVVDMLAYHAFAKDRAGARRLWLSITQMAQWDRSKHRHGPEARYRSNRWHARPHFARDSPSQSRLGTSTMIHQVDVQWHQTVVQTNTLSYAQRLPPKGVKLSHQSGPMTDPLDGLGTSTMLRYEVVRNAHLVLNIPTPLKGFGAGQRSS